MERSAPKNAKTEFRPPALCVRKMNPKQGKRFEKSRNAQWPGICRFKTDLFRKRCDGRLRFSVVAAEEYREALRTVIRLGHVLRARGVEAFHYARPSRPLRHLLAA
jgi:hypothetical protein